MSDKERPPTRRSGTSSSNLSKMPGQDRPSDRPSDRRRRALAATVMPDEQIVRPPAPPPIRGSEPPRAAGTPAARPMKATERLTANDVLQTLQARVATLEIDNARHVRERAEESDFSGKMLATLSEREEQMRQLRARLEDAERALDDERIASTTRRTELEDALGASDRHAEEAMARATKLQAELDAHDRRAREAIAKLEARLDEATAKIGASSAEQEGAKLAAVLTAAGAERARALLTEAQRLDGDLFTLRSRAYGAAEDMLHRLLDAAEAPKSARNRQAATPTIVLDPAPSLPISQRQVLPTASNSTDGMVALRSLPPLEEASEEAIDEGIDEAIDEAIDQGLDGATECAADEDDGPELLMGGALDDVDADLNDAFDAALSKRRDAE